jgi:hypothetical protein
MFEIISVDSAFGFRFLLDSAKKKRLPACVRENILPQSWRRERQNKALVKGFYFLRGICACAWMNLGQT